MAFVYDALGRTKMPSRNWKEPVAENSPNLFMMDVDPRMEGLRAHPRFTRLRNRVFRSLPAQSMPAQRRAEPSENVVISTYTAKDSTPRHRVAS